VAGPITRQIVLEFDIEQPMHALDAPMPARTPGWPVPSRSVYASENITTSNRLRRGNMMADNPLVAIRITVSEFPYRHQRGGLLSDYGGEAFRQVMDETVAVPLYRKDRDAGLDATR
jgi:hypothetical protein